MFKSLFVSLFAVGLLWTAALTSPPASALPPGAATINNFALPASGAAIRRAPRLLISLPAALRGISASYTWDVPYPIVEVPPPASAPESPAGLTADEQGFVDLINAERSQRGLCTLVVDPLLVRTARAHSREMCARDYFDHHSPTPGLSTPMDRYLSTLKDIGVDTPDYLLVGENIYYCSICSDVYNVDYAHRALMNSPGHRANILEPRFVKIGLGVYKNAKGEFWVTQMFSRDQNP